MDIQYFWIHPHLIELQWPKEISNRVLESQMAVRQYLEMEYAAGIKEIRMGFHSLSLLLQENISLPEWQDLLLEIKAEALNCIPQKFSSWRIPVCYGGEFGQDLENLAQIQRLTVDQAIALHVEPKYRIHFYGFLPGFMYLGGLNSKLATPRKAVPDRAMAQGTVAIGGLQTGIYPTTSPGGWHAIGRCPLKLFDMKRPVPVFPEVGDFVRFHEIAIEEYQEIEEQVRTGNYLWQHD